MAGPFPGPRCVWHRRVCYLVGALPVQFLLFLVPLHEVFHEGDCHFAVLKLGPAVFIFNGWYMDKGISYGLQPWRGRKGTWLPGIG